MAQIFLGFRQVLENDGNASEDSTGEAVMTQKMSRIRKDFILSHLRSNLQTLQFLISDIEDSQATDNETDEYLKKVETNLRTIRRLWKDH